MPSNDKSDRSEAGLFRQMMVGTCRQRQKYGHQKLATHEKLKPPSQLIHRNNKTDDHIYPVRQPAAISIDETNPKGRIQFARSGIQRSVLRRFKQGRYPCQTELDLHGLHTAQAESKLDQFITQCWYDRLRYLLIIHGQGLRSTSGEVLKTLTIQWLKNCPHILLFCSAQQCDGGLGALYVMLRKNLRNQPE